MYKNIRDRGTKKWTAMMLPEHVEALREWMAEDDYVEKPEFDDWELLLIQEEIERSVQSGSPVNIQTWKDGKIIPFEGVISRIDYRLRQILLATSFEITRISVSEVIRVQVLD